jgi:AraC-like DNA-binding protein
MVDASWLIEPSKAPELVEIDLHTQVATNDIAGEVEAIEAAMGLWLYLADLTVDADCTLETTGDLTGGWADFQFFVNGSAVFETSDGQSGPVSSSSGLAVRMIERRGRYHFAAGMRVRTIGVGVSTERLADVLGPERPPRLEPLVATVLPRGLAWPFVVNPSLRRIGQNLFSPMPGGRLRKLFHECSAVQILAVALAGLASDPAVRGRTSRPSRPDATRIAAARDRLLADLRTPASLDELAAEVGLGPRQLLRGFKTLYGQSPFEIVRNERLEHARIVLAETNVPLKEIAWRVGYADVTNFIHAFRRRFGAPPRRYAQADGDAV